LPTRITLLTLPMKPSFRCPVQGYVAMLSVPL
jgi:hypothetical protein